MIYLTHFYTTEGLPLSGGLRKITYITTRDEEGKFFLGTDNNPLPERVIKKLMEEKTIVALAKKVELPEDISLFISSNGDLLLAHRMNAHAVVGTIGRYDATSKMVQQ